MKEDIRTVTILSITLHNEDVREMGKKNLDRFLIYLASRLGALLSAFAQTLYKVAFLDFIKKLFLLGDAQCIFRR